MENPTCEQFLNKPTESFFFKKFNLPKVPFLKQKFQLKWFEI